MRQPDLVHPKKVDLYGYIFEVVSFTPLTDQKAILAAKYCYAQLKRTRKLRKRDMGGAVIFRAISLQ